jgi:uncharacterized protein (DUF362 family)
VVARPAAGGATTHPEIAEGLISYLQSNGFTNIAILEGSWVGASTASAFPTCGYTALAKKTGVQLIDTQKDSCTTLDCKGLKIEMCNSALAIDFMINLPVLKGHCQTLLTCALKNNKGIISDKEKRRFHSLGLDKPIAHLNTVAKNDFIVVDSICGDLDFEEGGNPVYAGRMFAARDPVLCDAWAAKLLGYETKQIPYIGLAESLGVGVSGGANVVELNKNSDAPTAPKPSGKAAMLSRGVSENGACSACYANLIFALSRLSASERVKLGEVCIGQGYKGAKVESKAGQESLGIGVCTSGFDTFCAGCPPTGAEIIEFLRNA